MLNAEITTDSAVFNAIEAHRTAYAVLNASCRLTDDVAARQEGRTVTDEDRAAFEAADSAEDEALEALANCAPATAAGLRAKIAYLIETAERGNVEAWLVELLLDSAVLAA